MNRNVIDACAVDAAKVIVIDKPELHSNLSNVLSKPGFLTLHSRRVCPAPDFVAAELVT